MLKRVQRPTEEINIVLIDEKLVMEAEQWILGCEHCADNAGIALDYILDAVTGCDPDLTEYIMCRPASCPFCSSEIHEKTQVSV